MHLDGARLGRRHASIAARTGVATLVAASLAAVVAVSAARADSPPAVQQYIESVPGGGGSHPLTPGGKQSKVPSTTLARKIDAQGGPYKPMLKAIVGSSGAGETRSLDGRLSPTAAPNAGVMTAAFDSGSTSDKFVVGAIVLGIAIASAVAAIRWRTSRRTRTS